MPSVPPSAAITDGRVRDEDAQRHIQVKTSVDAQGRAESWVHSLGEPRGVAMDERQEPSLFTRGRLEDAVTSLSSSTPSVGICA